jgi:HSP20 family protein
MLRMMIPWRERLPATFPRFENEMEDLVERFFGTGDDWAVTRFAPALDVAETEEAYEVSIELPGMKAEEVEVELKGENLWISGEKKEEKEEKGKAFHRVERRHGEFRRMVRLPVAVDEGKVEAKFTDGVLTVHVPKTEEVKPKRIPVQA